ncbi:helix-turn-helix transcriptional regulator [Natrinema sp. HArc-T2]|uniref:helix-turn-helix transcriptional regulator n=1 Tax=Natrinema sp. HArc-T2 TaxID=3242701 RepID=UPI00359F0DD6
MNPSLRRVLVTVLIALSLGIVPIGAVAIGQPDEAGAGDMPSIGTAAVPEPDTTVTRITIDENGTAHWSVTIRTRLANESDVADYEAFEERFNADRNTSVEQFERRMTGVVSSAEAATGRSMSASNFRAESSIQEVPRRWGTVTYSFRWTNFSTRAGTALVVGDVFEGGLYLDEDDRLQIVPPTGYTAAETTPPPDETDGETPVWVGPKNFADRQPTVRFEPAEPEVGSDRNSSHSWTGSPLVLAGATVVLVGLGIAVSVMSDRELLRQVRSSVPLPVGTTPDATEQAATDSDDALNGVNNDTNDRKSAGETADTAATAANPPSPDLVTDEDHVRALIEQHGGRMRQAAIAEELEWSASKTSRVVSGMAEEDVVEKLRVGRENVIDLVDDTE